MLADARHGADRSRRETRRRRRHGDLAFARRHVDPPQVRVLREIRDSIQVAESDVGGLEARTDRRPISAAEDFAESAKASGILDGRVKFDAAAASVESDGAINSPIAVRSLRRSPTAETPICLRSSAVT